MTSHPAGSDDDARGPAICKRPGCGRPLPAQGRGRNRVFCGGDCAQRFHNDARIPAPAAGAVTGDQDPLTALDALTRQAAVLVRAAREQAASLDPARVRAQVADAEAARRRAEAAVVTARAQAAEAREETDALAEALAAAREDAAAAQDAARHQADAARAAAAALEQLRADTAAQVTAIQARAAVERREGFPRFCLLPALTVPISGAGEAGWSAAAPCRWRAGPRGSAGPGGPRGSAAAVACRCGAGGWGRAGRVARAARRGPGCNTSCLLPGVRLPRRLAGWTMIEVFDTAAARVALARRALACPGCGSPLRPWGRARERTVRDLCGPVTLRPDRAMCTGCRRSHVVLDAGLLARRGYMARFVGVALAGAARGQGHRTVAAELGAPEATVRRAVVALDQDALPTRVQPTELGYALSALGAAAALYARRPALAGVGPWALINVLTGGQLLGPAAPA